MKRLIFTLLLICITVPVFAKGKSDDELLTETVALSKEVKEFGRTIGIEPTETLTKSSREQAPFSLIGISVQTKGKIDFTTFSRLSLGFKLDSGQMPIIEYFLWHKELSFFVRQIDQFAGKEAIITLDFAKTNLAWKVMVLLHEDLHFNVHKTLENNLAETLVTPLGFLAAFGFFELKNDPQNAQEIFRQINYYRKMSVELNMLEKDILQISRNIIAPIMLCVELKEKNVFDKYPLYKKWLLERIKEHGECVAEEAAITSDLMYWKYFDQVIGLYEKAGDIKILIEDLKSAPSNQPALEKYLDELLQKYSKTATNP